MEGGNVMQQRVELQQIMDEYTDLLFRIAYYYIKNIGTAEDMEEVQTYRAEQVDIVCHGGKQDQRCSH